MSENKTKEGHINLNIAESPALLIGERFHNVFNFSMNDEVAHNDYSPMAHYLFC